MLRAEINDFESARYTDERLEKILVVSAFKIYQLAPFVTDYKINVQSISITPDPVEIDDYDFAALVVAQAACMILSGEARESNSSGVLIKDGPSTLDTRDAAKNSIEHAKNACDNLKYLMDMYLMLGGNGINEVSTVRAVLTPYGSGSLSYAHWSDRRSD